MTPEDWPPNPSVILGRGQWVRVLRALEQRHTKADDALANTIRTGIDRDAARIAADHAAKATASPAEIGG